MSGCALINSLGFTPLPPPCYRLIWRCREEPPPEGIAVAIDYFGWCHGITPQYIHPGRWSARPTQTCLAGTPSGRPSRADTRVVVTLKWNILLWWQFSSPELSRWWLPGIAPVVLLWFGIPGLVHHNLCDPLLCAVLAVISAYPY